MATGSIFIDPASTGGGGGSGTVTSVSVVSANGLAGTVATATTTPAITLSTSITGVLKGNGTAISAATAGTDYQTPTGTPAGFVIASQAAGDVLYASSASAWARLPKGSDGQYMVLASGLPSWATLSAATLGANTFTALQTIAQASANAGILASTGYSLTGSNTTSMVSLAGTLNTSGAPSVLSLVLTDTASSTSTRYLSALGGASGTTELFSITKGGAATGVSMSLGMAPNTFNYSNGSLWIGGTNGGMLGFMPAGHKGWSFRPSAIANDDLALRQASAADGEPVTSTRAYFAPSGGVNIGGTQDVTAGICRVSSKFNVAGTDGATAGPFTTITSITVVGGIVTALTGS